MTSTEKTLHVGHRERLRKRYRANPHKLSEVERLELLLTYCMPRRDVVGISRALLSRFENLWEVISAPESELEQVPGIGEATLTFFLLLKSLINQKSDDVINMNQKKPSSSQLDIFELIPPVEKTAPTITKKQKMRVFANDEISNSLEMLPKAASFQSLEAYKQFLVDKLPYNAAETRIRRANYILERFYPDGVLNVPLTYFTANCSSKSDLKSVVFYHILKAEPIAAKVAEELIWSALPLGRIEREQIREFVLGYLPEAGLSSQKNMLRSLFYTYKLLDVGSVMDTTLRFQIHNGTLEGFLYLLTSEFPEPGIYSFEALFSSPVHRWMLWDREWLQLQLYNLQDFGILPKVSEIDTVRQFSIAMDQSTALHQFFEHPERSKMAIRESSENNDLEGEN